MDDEDDNDSLDQNPNPSSSPPIPIPFPDEEIEIEDQEEEEAVKSNGIHDDNDDDEDDDENANGSAVKKRKPLSSLIIQTTPPNPTKKPKKKKKKINNNSVWSHKSTSRKGKKKSKPSPEEDKVLITPIPRFPDRSDDSPDAPVALSKVHKAERVDLSEDRLCAASTKGYRMVRATRGVEEGHWYFEIKILKLGPTGHSRLGWSTEKGDLQAPVGYDVSSYGYRDVDGSKVHKAARQTYGTGGYGEGDVMGFYIGLPEGGKYAPKQPHFVWYKGQKYMYSGGDGKDELPRVVPGSEISFFKNGVCQGTAFEDLLGGRYYPAASMYTMPNESNCEVRFNFGPDFDYLPQEFGGRQTPRPMIEVPYNGYDNKVGDHIENGLPEKTN